MNLPDESKIPALETLLRSEVSLARYSTLQTGGPARFFSEPKTQQELIRLLQFTRSEGLPFLVIGKASNILFPDEGFPGLVITLIHFEQNRIAFDRERHTATVSSGVNLYRLATVCRDAGLGGTEFLSHIPGTLGGAVRMNAGFSRVRGVKKEIGDLVEELTVLTEDGHVCSLSRTDLIFQYRHTNLDGTIILEAKLGLTPASPEEIQSEILANFAYRNSVQDLRYPSAGSVFKNPQASQGSCGQMIEQVGLKGKRIGGAMISDRHANFIVNVGGARSADIIELVRLAQQRVWEEFAVRLEPEIQIIQTPEHLVTAS